MKTILTTLGNKKTASFGLAACLCLFSTGTFAAEGQPGKPTGDRKPNDPNIVGEEKAVLTQPPFVPPPSP